jgi:uncharacterized protein (DUF433 family)
MWFMSRRRLCSHNASNSAIVSASVELALPRSDAVETRYKRLKFAALVDLAVWYCVMDAAISSNPEIMGGTPCLAGTRVPFQTLLDYLEGGDSLDEFLEDFPSVSRELAIAAIQQAGDLALAHACVA